MSRAIAHALKINRVILSLTAAATVTERQQWQHRLDRSLGRVTMHPSLPPQAILVVRSLLDPHPGSLLSDNGWRGIREWEQATQSALNNCWRTAIRPAHSPVPANANSVLFADPAEWLACLSQDLYRGVAGDRWWWKTTLRAHAHRSKIETLVQLWREEVQWLPLVLSLLLHHDSTTLASLLTELPAAQTQQWLVQVAQIYQCPLLFPAAPQQTLSFLIAALEPRIPLSVRCFIQPLAPETQALIVLCLTLPNTAQFLDIALATRSTATPPKSRDQTPSADSHHQPDLSKPATSPAASDRTPVCNITRDRPTPAKIVAIQSTSLEDASAIEDPLDAQSRQPPDFSSEPSHSSAPLLTPRLNTDEDSTFGHPALLEPTPSLGTEQGIATAVGGGWYLVSVLVALGWPGRTATLTPWHQFLALAQALLLEVPLDPVWGLLAEIAGDPIPQPDLIQWQQTVLAQVQHYLAERLEQPEAIADYLLEPAILYLTRTHVDVVFTLDQIRLDVRMAGLDQDPGWVPELARVIAFHYE